MARPRRYPKAIDEVIWSALCVGMKSPEIARKLDADELGVGRSIPMPVRTVRERATKLKRERGEPEIVVGGLAECEAVLTEIRLAQLTDLRAMNQRLSKKARSKSGLTANEVAMLERIHRAASDIERAIRVNEPAKGRSRSKSSTQEKGGYLAELARDRKARVANGEGPLRQASTDNASGNGEAASTKMRQGDATRFAQSTRIATRPRAPAAA